MKRIHTRRSVSLLIEKNILEKALDLAYWTPGSTLSEYVESLLEKEIEHYEREHGPLDKRDKF